MVIYHQINISSLDSALKNGLKSTSRGDSGADNAIIKTDEFLDAHIPPALAKAGVSRCNNLYCYLGNNERVIDIATGDKQRISNAPNKEHVLLRVEADPAVCYVSDLDIYNDVMAQVEKGGEDAALARRYWKAIVPLKHFSTAMISRPEVMVTRDVPASHITVVSGP